MAWKAKFDAELAAIKRLKGKDEVDPRKPTGKKSVAHFQVLGHRNGRICMSPVKLPSEE